MIKLASSVGLMHDFLLIAQSTNRLFGLNMPRMNMKNILLNKYLLSVCLVQFFSQYVSAQIIPPQYIPPSDNDKTYIPVFRDYDPLRDDIADSIRQFRSPQTWNVIQVLEESDTTQVVAPDTFAKVVAFVRNRRHNLQFKGETH